MKRAGGTLAGQINDIRLEDIPPTHSGANGGWAVPSVIVDISPAVREDIRSKLVGEALRDRIRYRAEMGLEINNGAKPELHLKLYNYKLKFGSTSREITADSIEEKLSVDMRLGRVEAAQDGGE